MLSKVYESVAPLARRLLSRVILCFCFGLPASAKVTIPSFLKDQGEVKSTQGLFTLHQVSGRIYCEIPDIVLGRDMMITHTLLGASALRHRDEDKKTGYAGDLFGPLILRLRVVEDKIHAYRPLYDRLLSDKAPELSRIAAQRGDEAFLGAETILARGEGRSLIEVTALLRQSPYFSLSPLSLEFGLGKLRDMEILDIKGDDESLIIKTKRSYESSPMTRGQKEAPHLKTYLVGTCLTFLPETPLDLVRQTQRAYFYVSKNVFDTDPYETTKMYFSKRWRLEPSAEDRPRYDRGELVSPASPIIFHIDSNLPSKWVPYVVEAVEAWRPAFEKAGFKDAIRARPITKNSPFDISDSRHGYISWKVSPQRNAYGPHPNEPRSGEIMASHVGIFSSVLDILRDWYFVQCGASDPRARALELPDSTMGELIKMVVTHEIGHTLGLEHNFFASSMASIDQLRDDAYLSRHGISSSVMDYVRCNYALRPGDSVSLSNRISRLGAYDCHIIEQGYRLFPGKDASERAERREAWLAAQEIPREHVFMGGQDYRAQAEDLGRDHIAVNEQGIENMKFLCALPELWTPHDIHSLRVMQRRVEAMILSLRQWTLHVVEYIGGRERSDIGGIASEFVPIPVNEMRRAVGFVSTYALVPPMWLFDEPRFGRLEMDLLPQVTAFYQSLIPRIVDRVERLAVFQANGHKGVYTISEYLSALHATIFDDDRELRGLSQKVKEVIQRTYVEALLNLLDTTRSAIVRLEVRKALTRICDEVDSQSASTTDKRVLINELASEIELKIK